MVVVNQAFGEAIFPHRLKGRCCVRTAPSTRKSHKCHSEHQRRIPYSVRVIKVRSFGYRLRMTSRVGLWRRGLWIMGTVLSLMVVFLGVSPTKSSAQDK